MNELMRCARIVAAVVLLAMPAACQEGSDPSAAPAGAKPASPAGALVEAANLSFRLPEGWDRRAPSSNMRKAEATIPGPGGPGELAVFHFGVGKGGGADANLRRWIAQMDTEPGTIPEQNRFESGELAVTWVDVQGTLKAGPMGPKTDRVGYRLFGAVVEGPGGPWFFKATGPDATLAPRREDFLAMLRSAEPR